MIKTAWQFLKRRYLLTLAVVLVCLILGGIILAIGASAPTDFPERAIVSISPGMGLTQTANVLKENKIIRSPFLFKVFIVLLSGQKKILSGDYLFEQPMSALRVAHRVSLGIQGLPKITVKIIEGSTIAQIGTKLKNAIPEFDLPTFLIIAKPLEGYLFPDTYFFYENAKPQDVVDTLRQNFNNHIKEALLAIQASGKPLADVITMASIVEREATSSLDRRIIAGILWKRIEIGMPLQVDPPFFYILGKDSAALTLKDLAMDSPYNLYKHLGLPPTPIGNPGLEAIQDTVNPTTSKYLFYLSDNKGNMHYAATHDGHLANKAKYLQ